MFKVRHHVTPPYFHGLEKYFRAKRSTSGRSEEHFFCGTLPRKKMTKTKQKSGHLFCQQNTVNPLKKKGKKCPLVFSFSVTSKKILRS